VRWDLVVREERGVVYHGVYATGTLDYNFILLSDSECVIVRLYIFFR
jgi:hypothetical protein